MGDLLTIVDSPASDWDQHVRIEKSHMVEMRDGVRLSTDLYFPKESRGPLPCIFLRTPYSKKNYRPGNRVTANFAKYHQMIVDFVRQGFVFAIQDNRGRHESEGEFFMHNNDAEDGDDSLTWLGTREWSNKRIGMYGCSYSGDVQIIVAQQKNPYLKCIIPQGASGGGRFPYLAFRLGGVIELAMYSGWLRLYGALNRFGPPHGMTREELLEFTDWFSTEPTIPQPTHTRLREIWRHLPVIDMMNEWGGPPSGWEEFCRRELDDPWWKQRFDYVDESCSIDVPCLTENSWYDFGAAETLNMFNRFRDIALSEEVKNNQFAIMSPSCHCESEFAEKQTFVGDRDVGDARFDFFGLHLKWFNHWLKNADNGVTDRPKLQYYLMGAGEWRFAAEWPLANTQWTNFYLRSGGKANSRYGDGLLTTQSPEQNEPCDAFVYDPATPVPSRGGPVCCTGTPEESEGALDQSDIEMRHDVLVYSTPALEEDVDVVGPITLKIYVSSDVVDTDFTAKLIDVDKDGRAFNVQEGILRTRFREGFDKQVMMEAGEIYLLEIDLQATGNRFLKGHKIRLEISSSNFPRFERNLNTGGKNYDETAWNIAHQKVFHDIGHPSHLILPIIPQDNT